MSLNCFLNVKTSLHFYQNLFSGSGFGAGYNPHTTGPYYTNWGLQTCCQPVGPGFESRLIPGPGGQVQGQHVATHHSVETCVDDEIPCEIIESGVSSEEMVSSWTGICGVPGLGYSLRPQEGCDLETCQLAANTAQQVQDILNSEPEWSANSAQNLASLKVDLPRVNHHDLVRSRTVSVQQERSGQPRETASKQPNSASKSHSSSHSGGSVSGYNGVSAVSHLMSDSVNFERHNPASKSSNSKRPLRATVASRLRSKVSLPASWPSDNSGHSGSDKGPNSLPTQFIPRAPIPTPEILAAARSSSNKASNSKQNIVTQQKNREITTVQTSATAAVAAAGPGPNSNPHHLSSGQPVHSISGQNNKSQQDSFSANNEAILKQDQIYKSPKERDGDYSYAYDCSISPAVVIKWNEEDEGDSDFDLEETESDQDSILQEPQNSQPKPLPPVRRNQQVPSSNSREKTRQKKKHLPKKRSSKESTNKDAENIYEEIEDVKAQSASSSVNNSDSGIGGLIGNNPDHKSLNSYGSSSAKSSSGSAGGSAGIPMSKGTLDVSRPGRHKKSSNHAEQSAAAERSERAKRIAETRASAEARGSTGIPLSSLDALLSQTSPALTAHQRLSLRKSLVDELFEELIQRHHRRVLDELRLDVEEFIAPSPDFFDQPSATENSSNSNGTPKSSRSSANQSCSKLHRCESMDFKSAADQNSRSSKNNAENSAGLFKANNNGGGGNNNGTEPNKKIGSKLWQSARKCTEVIQRKLKKSPSTHFEQQNQQQQLDIAGTAAVNVGHGSISSPSTKPIQANAAVAPPVSLGPFLNRTQVTRRGHRPLSAIVSSSQNNNNYNKKSGSKHAQAATPVIDTLEDDLSDNEQDAADRRLLRSKIIKSFWEQHDQEGGDFSEPEVGSDKR